MANKLISEMGLPKSIANIFAARNIKTAKDALSLTEFELMELLDVALADVKSAVAHISAIVSPPYQTALYLMEQRLQHEQFAGHLPTRLNGLDDTLCGGIPFGVLTELVGPAGIGKTQFCLKISLLASLPVSCGGLDGHVIYIDVESKFSSRRIIEIGATSFPELFHRKEMAQEQIKILLLRQQVKLLVIDSMAALVSGEYDQGLPRQHSIGWHISFIKSLAEFSRIPVVVTNQVRSQSRDEVSQYSFQVNKSAEIQEGTEKYDSHVIAALGIHWAHAVTIRLVFEAKSGQRYIKVAKSPMSPPMAFPFILTSSGIALLDDDGIELRGQEINTIHCQGHNYIINFDGDRMQ
ncbi:DNA repair protein RAD51 homolog 2 isoform X2 [Jatropha curcas]|uniref:DNA repair protein RAD51 homolog 2 isoform X2 n=1 Tax=Jatropha curcas TaxID=180498 RepID=UPI0018949901|nr:DNA repair protein RAD51 homolog 2 isoform X2 [Jatropha curcas]